jgi:hypothetical protein
LRFIFKFIFANPLNLTFGLLYLVVIAPTQFHQNKWDQEWWEVCHA